MIPAWFVDQAAAIIFYRVFLSLTFSACLDLLFPFLFVSAPHACYYTHRRVVNKEHFRCVCIQDQDKALTKSP